MINANQITSRLRMMSDQELQRFAEMHKQDPYMFPLAFNESNMRKEMRAAPQGQGAAPQAPVNQQALAAMQPAQLPEDQGIGALNPNMQFADGGLVSFAGGGESTAGPYSRADDRDFGTGGVAYADGGTIRFAEGEEVPSPRYGRGLIPNAPYRITPYGGYGYSPEEIAAKKAKREQEERDQAAAEEAFAQTPEGRRQARIRQSVIEPLKAFGQGAVDLATFNPRLIGTGLNKMADTARAFGVPAPMIPGLGTTFEAMPLTSAAGKVQEAKAAESTAAGMAYGPERAELTQGVAKSAEKYSAEPDTAWSRMTRAESGQRQFDPKTGEPLRSSAGAIGYAQLLPSTAEYAAKKAGIDWNPELFSQKRTGDKEKDEAARAYNERIGKAYYEMLVSDFGNPAKATAAYNWGEGNLRKAIKKYGDNWIEHLPPETEGYLAKVYGHPEVAKQVARGPSGGFQGASRPSEAYTDTAAAPAPAPSGMSDEGLEALSKKFATTPKVQKLVEQRIKEQGEAEAEREKEYLANRPESVSFKERKAALEEDRADVEKESRMNEGLAWLTFASKVVQPGKNTLQALVEGASAGGEQYARAQKDLKKAEKERKLGLAAISEAEDAAKRGDWEKAQARKDAAAARMDASKNAGLSALTTAMGGDDKAAMSLVEANMARQSALERAKVNPQLDLLRAAIADPQIAAMMAAKKEDPIAQLDDFIKARPDMLGKPVAEQLAAFKAVQMALKPSQQPQVVASSANPLTR